MKLRIGKPAIAPQADEPIVPLQKPAGASPFSKLLRAANDEPRLPMARAHTSGLPANDPSREVPLLTVAHGPLQPPPNPGRRSTDVVKTPAPERGLVERLRVVSEPATDAPLSRPGDRRAADVRPRAPELRQPETAPAKAASTDSTSHSSLTAPALNELPRPTPPQLARPATPSVTPPPQASSGSASAQATPQPTAPTNQHTKVAAPVSTHVGVVQPNAQPAQGVVQPAVKATPETNLALQNPKSFARDQPSETVAPPIPHHAPRELASAKPAPAFVQPNARPSAPELPAYGTTRDQPSRLAQSHTREAVQPHPTSPQTSHQTKLATATELPRPAQPNPPLRTKTAADGPSAAPTTPFRTKQATATEQQRLERTTTNLQPAPQQHPAPAHTEPALTPSPREPDSPRAEQKPLPNSLHRRRVVESNVKEKPHTEKNAPAQSPTAPLVTTSNTSFVAAPDQRPVVRASPDTPVAPHAQDFAHRPSSTVRDEATATSSHAPALREPPAIAATLFSVSPTVSATAVDTKHFGTPAQALKSQPTMTAPIAHHAVEQRPTAAAPAPKSQVAQVLELAAHRTTKPAEPARSVTASEEPAPRKLERVETKKATEVERDDKSVTPLPSQPAPLQPNDLPPAPRAAEAGALQQPNPLPNVAPAYLDDPTLRVVVLPNVARLNVETQDSGTLSLQVKVHDGVTDIRAAGPAASLVEARQGELRLALAHEGLALGHFDLTQSDHQGASQQRFEPHDEREPLPRRTHVRPESSSSTTRAEGRLSVKA